MNEMSFVSLDKELTAYRMAVNYQENYKSSFVTDDLTFYRCGSLTQPRNNNTFYAYYRVGGERWIWYGSFDMLKLIEHSKEKEENDK